MNGLELTGRSKLGELTASHRLIIGVLGRVDVPVLDVVPGGATVVEGSDAAPNGSTRSHWANVRRRVGVVWAALLEGNTEVPVPLSSTKELIGNLG